MISKRLSFGLAAVAGIALATPVAAQDVDPTPAETSTQIDPAKLAIAQRVVDGIWPEGAYAEMMQQMMGMGPDSPIMSGIFDTEFLGEGGEEGMTLREQMAAEDPHFEERMQITNRVMGEFMGEIFGEIEPDIRAALAEAYARRNSTEHLRAFADFLDTDAGQAISADYLLVYQDEQFMSSMMDTMPVVMSRMGELQERMAEATAHLPPAPGQSWEAQGEEHEDELSKEGAM